MPRLPYSKAINPDQLQTELVAAIPALAPVTGAGGLPLAAYVLEQATTGTDFWLTVPDAVSGSAVAAVVAAHNAATQTTAQQQAAQDAADLAALKTQYTADVAAIQSALTTIGATAWDSLTGPQRTGAVQGLLQRQLRVYKALAVIVRRIT